MVTTGERTAERLETLLPVTTTAVLCLSGFLHAIYRRCRSARPSEMSNAGGPTSKSNPLSRGCHRKGNLLYEDPT